MTKRKLNVDQTIPAASKKKQQHRPKTKWTIELLREQFVARGHTLLSTEYKGADEKYDYTCACGEEDCSIKINLLIAGGDNCKPCAEKRRRATVLLKEADRKNKGLENVRKIFLDYGHTLTATDYTYYNDKYSYTCKCGTTDCLSSAPQLKLGHDNCKKCADEKRTATIVKRFGVECVWDSPEIQEKKTNTTLANWGVSNPFFSKEIREKIKSTTNTRYGVDHSIQSQEVQDKIKATNMKNIGVERPLQLKAIREKGNETMLRTTGFAYGTQSQAAKDKAKATNLAVRGVPHQSQCPEVHQKMLASSFSVKEYTFPSGETIRYQGYELSAVKLLVTSSIAINDIVEGYEKLKEIEIWYEFGGTEHRYFPDIFVPSQNKIIEVKSTYTYQLHKEQNHAKLQATKELGYNCEIHIFDGKERLVETIPF